MATTDPAVEENACLNIGDINIQDEEDLLAQHRKEKKELQAKAQKLKNSVPKGDKKKKKEITDEISTLEKELDKKQKAEVVTFREYQSSKPPVAMEDNPVTDGQPAGGDSIQSVDAPDANEIADDAPQSKKSKAQKRRDKKQAAGREREDRIRQQETVNKLAPRHLEMMKLKETLKARGLAVHEIPADGNCMYTAVCHQLTAHNREQSTNEELRRMTSEFMRSHRDDFLPFLTHPDTGDMLTEDEFELYCDKTASTPCWGGQIELRALSEALRVPIEVIQADSAPLVIGEEMSNTPLTVVYHRHVFRLGEHYNSVAPLPAEDEEDS